MSVGGSPARSLGAASARGGMVTLGGQGAQLVIQMASLVVLARLLEPREYGLMAIVVVIIGVGEVFRDFGLSTAAVQAETISSGERSNLWWCSTAIGAVLTASLLASSPLIAGLYGQAELLPIVMVMSSTFLISGMSSQFRASLQREMRFGALALIAVGSGLLALAFAITAALAGWGAWALVVQNLAGAILALAAMLGCSGWHPRRYDRAAPIGRFFRFGLPLLGTQAMTYLASNIDAALIGLISGPGVVGLYSRAVQTVRMPLNQIRTPVSQVAFSALSRQQRDTRMLVRFAERGQLLLAYPMVLMAGGISAAAAPLVTLVLGAGWEGVIPFLHLIAIGEGLNTMAMTGGWLYTVRGKTASLMRYTLFSAATRLALLTAGIMTLGPLGAAAAAAVAPILLWPISLIWAGRVAEVPTRSMLAASYRIFAVCSIASLATAAVVWGSSGLAPGLTVLLAVLTQLSGAAVLGVIPRVRQDYQDIWQALKLARA